MDQKYYSNLCTAWLNHTRPKPKRTAYPHNNSELFQYEDSTDFILT